MKKKTGTIFMIIGAVLVSSALLLFAYNQWDAKRAEKEALETVNQLKKNLNQDDGENQYIDSDGDMKIVTIDGYDYIGYISIPSINLELPVMAEWSYAGLKIAPGRYYGST